MSDATAPTTSMCSVESFWTRTRKSPISAACVVAYTLFTDMLTYGAVLPVLPTLVLQRLGGNSSMVGILFGVYAFGLLLATPVFAILSDKYQNRRYPMMTGCIGLVASTLAFAAADSYLLLILARIAQGVAGGASWTIGLGMVADVFPTNRLGVVMGTVLTAHTVGFAIGPAMGGFLFEYAGFSAPFLCCAIFAAINFLAVAWVAEPNHDKHINKKDTAKYTQPTADSTSETSTAASTSSHLTDDEALAAIQPTEETPLIKSMSTHQDDQVQEITMWGLCKNWKIMCCVLCTTISASVFSGIEPALPIHLEKTYDSSASTVGVIFVAMVVPAFLAPAIGFLSDRIGRDVISASGMLLMAVAAPLVSLNYPIVYMIVPALMVFGFSSPLTLTPILPEMGEIVDSLGGAAYAQVYALYNMAYSMGMFLGPVYAGAVMAVAGFKTLMFTFAIALVICSPVMMDWKAVWRRLTACVRSH
ncbi:MFS general substrate transporter [Lichtheimia hyalospora FSU 10163]|nr:MFS general substrate transporter [Lichtheimia hyalospora FSU 10163]